MIEPTCTEEGYTEEICSLCGDCYEFDYTEALGHENGRIVGKVGASKAGQGYTVYSCIRCGIDLMDDYTDFQPTEEQVYHDIMALKEVYKQGAEWTNDNYYKWKGGIWSGGYGCAGFAFLLSDEAFGYLPARQHTDFSNIKAGDIIRINNDTHSVIVLKVNENGEIYMAEGNLSGTINWNRCMSYSELQQCGIYVLTRYPE